MKTVVLIVGNAGRKLTQVQWSMLVKDVEKIVDKYSSTYSFLGGSPNWSDLHYVSWHCDFNDTVPPLLKESLIECRQKYDLGIGAIAYIEGETEYP